MKSSISFSHTAEERACAAYYRGSKSNCAHQQHSISETLTIDGDEFVILSNRYVTLAVYKTMPSGMIRRQGMCTWPAKLQ